MVSIHDRPAEATDRLMPGNWEGDLMKSRGNALAVVTLLGRSLFAMPVKLDGSTAIDALNGSTLAFSALPPEIRQTLTYDQGRERALHQKLAENIRMTIYFCDPHSPWQRGINQNTNGLLRQCLPMGTDLSVLSQRELDQVAREVDIRPPKILAWRSPVEVFFDNIYRTKQDLSRMLHLDFETSHLCTRHKSK